MQEINKIESNWKTKKALYTIKKHKNLKKERKDMALPDKAASTEEDYYNLPETVRAELIDGKIYYLAAPNRIHQKISSELYTVINQYIKSKHGICEAYYAPFAVKLWEDRNTIVEPDISVICTPGKLTDRGCTGAPDWIIEIISPSNPGDDYVHKLNLYMDAGVREYWIVDPRTKSILVYFLEQSDFQVEKYTFNDKIKTGIYDDLYIDFTKLSL